MRKLLLIVAIVVSAVAGALIVKPGLRTKWYFAADRAWTTRWPLAYGKGIVRGLRPLIRPTEPAWVTVEPSVTMLLDPADSVSAELLRKGTWQPESWNAIRPYLTGDAVFVDVGAHMGYYSLKAAAVLGPRGRVIAVEPNPPRLKALQGNISASNAAQVHVYPVACLDRESTLKLYSATRANTGQTSLSRGDAGETGAVAAEYRVRARPLDAIVLDDGVQRVDVIKIDVEGAETLVLRGAQWTLDRFHPVVIVELIEKQLQAKGTSSAELRRLLTSHGYAERADAGGTNFVFKWDGGTGDARPFADD
jgi:FkbM family methyltransferase